MHWPNLGSAASTVGLRSSLFESGEKGWAAQAQNKEGLPSGQAPLSAARPGYSRNRAIGWESFTYTGL